MSAKKKLSKKEAEEIRLAIAEIAEDHSLKHIFWISMFQIIGSSLFMKTMHSRHKFHQNINYRLLKLLIKLYDSCCEQ